MARTDWKRPALTPLAEGMKRVRLTLSYDGSLFNGWQSQDNGVGVQDVLNEKLGEIYGLPVRVQGSGRTDAGVHALGQVAHYDVPIGSSRLEDGRVALALNARLPHSIRILESASADASFHARFTTMAREYKYFVKAQDEALPFDEGHVGLYRRLPEIALLDGYARQLSAMHDSSSAPTTSQASPAPATRADRPCATSTSRAGTRDGTCSPAASTSIPSSATPSSTTRSAPWWAP